MDDLEYRPIPDERDDEFRAFMRYAFSPQEGPYDPETDDDDREHLGDHRGLFEGDEPVAVCGHHAFTLRIRGRDRDAAGLSAVASPPEHRRQGHVRRLLRESLAEHRADGVNFSVLWPFEYAFYRRYGWATVSRYRRVETPPEQLRFAGDDASGAAGDGVAAGRFRRLDADDYEVVADLLAAAAERHDFTMARTEAWWRERSLRGWKTDPFVYGFERNGELRALLSYAFDERDDGDGTTMVVGDATVADPAAWDRIFRFCRDHDSQVDRVRLSLPEGMTVLDRVDDPRAVSETVRPGPMFRLVDVPAALEALTPDPDLETAFTLAVDDPLVDWHDCRIRVVAADGTVEAERIGDAGLDGVEDRPRTVADDDAADDGDGGADADDADDVDAGTDADVSCGIGALSQLYAGYRGVDDLRAHAAFDVAPGVDGPSSGVSPDALFADLADLFPPRRTFLREGF